MRMISLTRIGRIFNPAPVALPAPPPPSSYGIQSWACTHLATVHDAMGKDADFRLPKVCQIERLRTLCGHPLSYRLRLPDGTQRSVPAAMVHVLPAGSRQSGDVVDLSVFSQRLAPTIAAE